MCSIEIGCGICSIKNENLLLMGTLPSEYLRQDSECMTNENQRKKMKIRGKSSPSRPRSWAALSGDGRCFHRVIILSGIRAEIKRWHHSCSDVYPGWGREKSIPDIQNKVCG
jgi:hypothetical protein